MDVVPDAMAFHTQNFKQHAVNPLFAFEVLQADEGSITARFAAGVQKLSQISQRWSKMHFEAHKIDVQRQRRRRLQETDAKARTSMLYDRLEALVAQREDEHVAAQKKNGRRLDEQALRAEAQAAVRRRVPELPATHALSWVHELVDWPSLADEWTRLYDVLVQRNAMRLHGRQMHEILHAHPTGYSFWTITNDSPSQKSATLFDACGTAARMGPTPTL